MFTGPALWIWYSRQIPEPEPLRFRAWKEFPVDGAPPASAPARLFGDREWALEVNGQPAGKGSQRPGDALALLELGPLLKTGGNRISVEASSPNGVGGLLFWMDIGRGRLVVSDGTWRVERIPAGTQGPQRAAVWGKPPLYPWGYPRLPGSSGFAPQGSLVEEASRSNEKEP